MSRTLTRIAHEILEKNPGVENLAVVGIHTRGAFLATRIHDLLCDVDACQFAAGNIDQLSRDFARGEGEALSAFAHLLDVPEGQRATFGSFVQANFVQLFPHADVDSNEMIDTFDRLL